MRRHHVLLLATIVISLSAMSSSYAGEYTNVDIGFPDTIHTTVIAVDINNTGQLLGYGLDPVSSLNVVSFVLTSDNGVWFRDADSNGTNDLMEVIIVPVLDSLASLGPYTAMAINDAGQVVGRAFHTPLARYKAFLWENGVFTILPPPNDTARLIESWARDINDAGQIVGGMWSASNGKSTFGVYLWDNGVCQYK